MLWFPELFNRFEKFEQQQPGKDVSMCQVSSVYIEHNGALNTADLCGSEVGVSVYTHTLWIGVACIPTSLWMPLCVHKLGAKFFLGENPPFCIRFVSLYAACLRHGTFYRFVRPVLFWGRIQQGARVSVITDGAARLFWTRLARNAATPLYNAGTSSISNFVIAYEEA